MGYLGNIPGDKFLTLSSQQITGTGSDTYTLDYPVSSSSDIAVFVNNVRQNVSSYTASNTTLTLGGTISASDECWVHFLGKSVGSIAPATGSVTNAMLAGSIATSKLADGSTFATTNGITEADMWRLTTDLSGDQLPISTNWERVDTNGQGYIGTGMSQSSGIFTFPSTGLYLVRFTTMFENTVAGDALINAIILTTTNGSTWDNGAFSYTNAPQNYYHTAIASLMFDVTNTSTHKVKFHTENVLSTTRVLGNTNVNVTNVSFVRLGDT